MDWQSVSQRFCELSPLSPRGIRATESHESECLVDAKDKAGAITRESIVETHIHSRLEAPTQAKSVIGQCMAQMQAMSIAETIGSTSPPHHSESLPQVLAELQLRLDDVTVSVSSLIVTSHAIVCPDIGILRPGDVVSTVDHRV